MANTHLSWEETRTKMSMLEMNQQMQDILRRQSFVVENKGFWNNMGMGNLTAMENNLATVVAQFSPPSPSMVLDSPKPMAVPEKVAVVADEGVTAEYLELAAAIGLESPAVLDARLKLFLEQEHMQRYSSNAVRKYMDNLVNRESAMAMDGKRYTWGWYPLRLVDRRTEITGWTTEDGRHMAVAQKVYTKAVPKVPLMTVKKIFEAFGNLVSFFVTDYEARRPDPFLGVAGVGTALYIVERWDEPGFRDAA